MKKLLILNLLLPIVAFAQTPPPPIGARSVEDIEAVEGPPPPGLPIDSALLLGFLALLGVSLVIYYFNKYRLNNE